MRVTSSEAVRAAPVRARRAAALLSILWAAWPTAAHAQKPEDVPPVFVMPEEASARERPDVSVSVSVGGAPDAAPPGLPEEQTPPPTHFIAELGLGATVRGAYGIETSMMLGAGGRLGGFPPIFYAVLESAFATAAAGGQISSAMAFADDRRFWDLSLGLRVYVPVWGPLRIFFDVLGGTTRASASLERTGVRTLEADERRPMASLSAGFQSRVIHRLSVGARVKLRFTDDGLADVRDELHLPNDRPVSVTGTATWHF